VTKRRPTVRLICWNEERASALATELEGSGFAVARDTFDVAELREMGSHFAAVVIDLGRLPAQGRDLGIALRTRASSRRVPLIFVEGASDKVANIRSLLPDAVYSDRKELAEAVRTAMSSPPVNPVVPASVFAGYSGTPLPKKLGIKQGSNLALVDPPPDFESTLGDLPEGVSITYATTADADVTLWFLNSRSELRAGIGWIGATAGGGRLWICWPKKSSGIAGDVTQNEVRSTGLAIGLVDFKICSIDATWSGLCFTRRKK
jgi:hypothetical protein